MKMLKNLAYAFILVIAGAFSNCFPGPVPVDPARMDFSEIQEPISLKPQLRAPSFSEPTVDVPVVGQGNKLTVGGSVSLDFYMFKHARTLDKKNDWDRHDQFRQRNEFAALFQAAINPVSNNPMVKTKISIGNTLFLRTLFSPLDYNDSTIANGSSLDFNQAPTQVKFQEAWAEVDLGEVFKDKTNARNFVKFGFFPFMVGRGLSLGDWTQGGPQYLGFDRTGVQTYAQMYPGGILGHVEVGRNANVEFYFSPTVAEDISGAQRTGGVVIERDVKESYGRHVFAVSGNFTQQTKAASIEANPYWVNYNSPRQSVDVAMDAPINLHTVGMMVHAKSGALEFNVEVAKQTGHQTFKKRTYQDFPSSDHYNFVAPRDGNDKFFWNGSDYNYTTHTTGASGSYSPEVYALGDPGDVSSREGLNIPAAGNYLVTDGSRKLGEHHPEFEISLSGWMAVFDMRYKCKDYPLSFASAIGYFSGGTYPYNDNVDQFWFSKVDQTESKAYKIDQTTGKATIYETPKKEFKGFIGLRDYRYVGMWAKPLIMVNAGVIPRPKEVSLFDFVAYNDSDSLSDIFMVGCAVECQPLAQREKLNLTGNFFAYWKDSKMYKWNKADKNDVKIRHAEGQSGHDLAKINGWFSNEAASSYYGFEVSGILEWKVAKNVDFSLRGGFFVPGQFYKDIEGMTNVNLLVNQSKVDPKLGASEFTTYGSLGHDIAWGIYTRMRYSF